MILVASFSRLILRGPKSRAKCEYYFANLSEREFRKLGAGFWFFLDRLGPVNLIRRGGEAKIIRI